MPASFYLKSWNVARYYSSTLNKNLLDINPKFISINL